MNLLRFLAYLCIQFYHRKEARTMTIKKQPNGNWMARVSYKDTAGKYKQKSKYTFKTKKEAQLWENKMNQQTFDGISIGENPIFSDYFLQWFYTYKEQKVMPATRLGYLLTHKKINEYFFDLPLKDITRMDYQKFINDYGQNHAVATVKKRHKHIRSCIKEALVSGMMIKDFTYKVEIVGLEGKKEEKKFLSEKETKKLISSLKDDNSLSRKMAILALGTGMRYAEIAGLTYDSVNTSEQTLLIDKAWDYSLQKFKQTKTKNSRTIKLEPSLLKDLNILIIEQKKKQLKGSLTNPHSLVFAKYNGIPPTNNAANKSLRRACNRAAIKEITFHSLRHTHVSILLYKGMDLFTIAKRVGHSSTTTTADVYAHVIEEMQNKSDRISDNAMKELFSL